LKRRHLLAGFALCGAAVPVLAQASRDPVSSRGPALLTVSGHIAAGNRGPLDPALDQLMKKHGVEFTRAYSFDFAALGALPATAIAPTLEYDNRQHRLTGPLLSRVLRAAGAQTNETTRLLLRAIDGYTALVPLAEVDRFRFIVATHLDGQPIPLGGLGPLWAVYEPDAFPEMASKPASERFALCPWGLYHVEVQ